MSFNKSDVNFVLHPKSKIKLNYTSRSASAAEHDEVKKRINLFPDGNKIIVKSVQRILNKVFMDLYEKRKCDYKNYNEKWLFHGTKQKYVNNICRRNLIPGGAFNDEEKKFVGKAVYFSKMLILLVNIAIKFRKIKFYFYAKC